MLLQKFGTGFEFFNKKNIMKKIGFSILFVVMVFATNAQEHKTEAGKAIDSTKKAVKIGANAVAEISVKGVATVLDQKIKNKVGPYGKTVYVNGDNKIYYVNKRGTKVFIKKAQLKNR